MTILTPAEFADQCEQQAREADVEWAGKHAELWMDQCDCPPELLDDGLGCQNERCQRCGLAVADMPTATVCGIDMPQSKGFGLVSPETATTYWWTTCPDCSKQLQRRHLTPVKETPNA